MGTNLLWRVGALRRWCPRRGRSAPPSCARSTQGSSGLPPSVPGSLVPVPRSPPAAPCPPQRLAARWGCSGWQCRLAREREDFKVLQPWALSKQRLSEAHVLPLESKGFQDQLRDSPSVLQIYSLPHFCLHCWQIMMLVEHENSLSLGQRCLKDTWSI